MANEVFVLAEDPAGVAFNDNTTRFTNLGSRIVNTNIAETNFQATIRKAGTFSNLYCYVTANTTLVNSTVTLRKSVADTALLVTYGSGETGIKENTSDTVSFANTDEADHEITVANDVSGATSITLAVIGVQFVSDTSGESASFYIQSSNAGFNTDSVTNYSMAFGLTDFSTTEAQCQFEVRGSFTSANFSVNIGGNARTTNTTFKTRKNTADGAASVTYTSGETGQKEDTSNTDSLALGDEFGNAIVTSTGGGTITPRGANSTVYGTSNEFQIYACRPQNGVTQASAVTNYNPVYGWYATNGTEANSQYYSRFSFTAKQLVSYIRANSLNGTTNIYLRDNGGDSSLTVAYTTGQTGVKNDTTNSATITAVTDEIDYKITTAGSSGTIAVTYIGILGETAAANTFVPRVMMM